MEKGFLYVGHYYDVDGNYILKIGKTTDLKRRRNEHNSTYKKAKNHPMPEGNSFEYDWALPLSRYTTERHEDKNRELWQLAGVGEFIRNDRFYCAVKPQTVEIKIRKTYIVSL